MSDNTLFLRLAGPMQSWGTASRSQLRRSDAYPSKSGVLGLLLCARGVRREDSSKELEPLLSLSMGVRVDRAGTLDWDYHTVGAKIGNRKAEGGIKHEGNIKSRPFETLLSRRQYLFDASFLVAIRGDSDTIRDYAGALDDPIWPVFLGRKSCVPAEPVLDGTGVFDSLGEALRLTPWRARIDAIDRQNRSDSQTLDTFIEHPVGSPPPKGARLVYDVPRVFGYDNHGARWVIAGQVTVSVGEAIQKPVTAPSIRRVDYTSTQWKAARLSRLTFDHGLCVFCKSPAIDVHHVDYTNVGRETDADLRSLCKICHEACTMLEYGTDMRQRRIDPSDVAQRPAILEQIARVLKEQRQGRRRDLLADGRNVVVEFFDELSDSRTPEGR
jgi:CRISPR system Cascade subunit CasD